MYVWCFSPSPDAEASGDDGISGSKKETPGDDGQNMDGRGSETVDKKEDPYGVDGDQGDGEGDHSDGEGDHSDGEGDQGDGEGDPSDQSDGGDVTSEDDDDAPVLKRISITTRRQRIDSDNEDESPPVLKQSISLGSSSGDSVPPNLVAGSSPIVICSALSDGSMHPLIAKHASQVDSSSNSQLNITSVDTRDSESAFKSLAPREVECETTEVCSARVEEVMVVDSGLGLSTQDNSCSQMVIDASSQEGSHLQVTSEEGSHLQFTSEEGSHLQVISEEGSQLQVISEEGSCLQAADCTADASFNSFPPAQRPHTFKVGMTCRKNSTTSNHSDQVRGGVVMVADEWC